MAVDCDACFGDGLSVELAVRPQGIGMLIRDFSIAHGVHHAEVSLTDTLVSHGHPHPNQHVGFVGMANLCTKLPNKP